MTLRDRQKAQTRALVLEAAAALFAEQGYEATTTRAVAERAGVAAGTVFAHFADKAALGGALLYEHVEAALDRAFATLPPGDVVTRLVHVATTLYAAYDARPDLSRALLQAALFRADADGPLGEQLRAFEAWAGGEIAHAVERGEMPPVPLPVAFAAFFTQYFGLLLGGLRGEIAPAARAALLDTLVRRSFGMPT